MHETAENLALFRDLCRLRTQRWGGQRGKDVHVAQAGATSGENTVGGHRGSRLQHGVMWERGTIAGTTQQEP